MKALLIIIYSLFYTSSSFAALGFEDAAYPEIVTSSRALGMGNAYLGKVDDSWAAFYNPAGLGTVRKFQFHFANVHLETNNGFLGVTAGDGAITDVITKYKDALTAEGMRSRLEDNPGKLTHARLQLFPNITFKGFTLGYFISKQNRARIKDVGADYEIAERSDHGPVMALSFSLWGGIVKFGASAMYLTRKELQKDFAPGTPTDINDDVDYRKGSTTLVTVGSRVTLPVAALPTFSAVLRNSTQMDWYNEGHGGTPKEIPQTFDLGLSITPLIGKTLRMHLEINRKDVGDRYAEVSNSRKLTGGIEFDYMRKVFLRLGHGDGWGSVGVGVRNKHAIFDFTTYGVELSDSGYRKEEDRRWVLSMASGF